MNTAPKFDSDVRASESIWLELVLDGTSWTFELSTDEMRAVVVGSLPGADLRINRPGVAPVHFHIERDGNTLWIVPAYGSGDLRVDTQRLVGPRPINGRAVIEFSNSRVYARIRDSGSAVVRTLTGNVGTSSDAQTLPICQCATPGKPATEQTTKRLVPLLSQTIIPVNKTVIIEPCQVSPLVRHQAPGDAPPAPPADLPAHLPLSASDDTEPSSRPSAPDTIQISPEWQAQMESGQSTSTKVQSAEPAHFEPAQVLPLALPRAPTGAQCTTVFDMPVARRTSTNSPGYLARLGTLSRQRPWLVWGLGSACAFALSASLTLGLKCLAPGHGLQVPSSHPLTQSWHAPAPSNAVSSIRAPTAARSGPDSVIVIGPITSTAATPEKKGTHKNPELAAAVSHLAAGRYQEARDAYTRLSAREPNDRSLTAVAQVLTKKLAAPCNLSAPSANTSCPEVMR